MNFLRTYLQKLHTQESAATSVEYAVMIGMIILACIAGITTLGGETLEAWFSNSDKINDAMNN